MKNLLISLAILAFALIGSVFANKNIKPAVFYVQDAQGNYNRMSSYNFEQTACNLAEVGICAYEDLSIETYPPALPPTLTSEQVLQLSDPIYAPITLKPMQEFQGYYDPF